MLAFEGDRLPDWVERRVRDAPVAGVTLWWSTCCGPTRSGR